MSNYTNNKNYFRISPTAYGVAFRRTLAEIDYAQDIYNELEAIKANENPEEIAKLEKMKAPEISPFFEARYKLVNELLEKFLSENDSHQILEVAAGLSPRGISMTESDSNLRYVELDLPSMLEEKVQINQALTSKGKITKRQNHFLEKGDALEISSLNSAVEHFEEQPIAIINEGLMRYLTFEQKTIYARNIASLLKKFGGVWITPDINFKDAMKFAQERTSQFSKDLGTDINANLFEDEESARKFFEDLGFIVEVHPFTEIADKLITPQKLGISLEELGDMLNRPVVYVMHLKP